MDKFLNTLVDNLKKIFKERLSSVFLYGSCAVEDCSKSFSDINLMVIIEDLCAADLKKAHGAVDKFVKNGKYLPIFMDKEEWFNSCDVYSIEYSDIKERNKIVYGENLIDGLTVNKANLRLQCELELKNLLVRLRQTYLAKSTDKKVLKNLIYMSSKTFLVIFRAILRLLEVQVPIKHNDVIVNFSDKIKECNCGIDFDCEMFLKILEFREKPKHIKDEEFETIIQKLIDTTNSVLKYVDKLEV